MDHWCEHGFIAIGVSEVFEVEHPAHQIDRVDAHRQDILVFLVDQLNRRDSVGWCGHQDAHNLSLWHE